MSRQRITYVASHAVSTGRTALAEHEWDLARRIFDKAVEDEPGDPAAHEGLAEAAWWRSDAPTVFAARETAYRIFLSRGDRRGAARMALWLASDTIDFRGEFAVANGWMQRARRHLDGMPLCVEALTLQLYEGYKTLNLDNDTAETIKLAVAVADGARQLGSRDLEGMAIALEGLARIGAGEVEKGTGLLDEAGIASTNGEISDPVAVVTIFCNIVAGCDKARDFDRADQWCRQMDEFSEKIGAEEAAALCRPHYATLLMWRGRWPEAEDQLQVALRDLSKFRPPLAVESSVKLAELRIRQGRIDEAFELLKPLRSDGLSDAPLAEIDLVRGSPTAALELAQKRLRHLPANDVIERIEPLDILVRAALELGQMETASDAASELARIAQTVGTPIVKAQSTLSSGMFAAASGELEEAARLFEDSLDAFEQSTALFEAARVRRELARLHMKSGRRDLAAREAMLGLEAFRSMGAQGLAMSCEALLREMGTDTGDGAPGFAGGENSAGLSRQELVVLGCIARGMSNTEIAAALDLSVRTVERHITNLYSKLELSGKAARAAATSYAYTHGLI